MHADRAPSVPASQLDELRGFSNGNELESLRFGFEVQSPEVQDAVTRAALYLRVSMVPRPEATGRRPVSIGKRE